jgi:signal peptidase I
LAIPPRRTALPESGVSIPWVALVAAPLSPQFLRPLVNPTGSTENTLLIGDRLLARVGSSTPARNSLVIFRYLPETRQIFIERCAGLPGERIKIVNKQLYVNGVKAIEPYAVHKTEYVDTYRDNFPSEATLHLYKSGQDLLANHVQNAKSWCRPIPFRPRRQPRLLAR